MTEPQTYTFHHAELGPMTGLIRPDKVVQFRAIPYATVPARFKKSVLLETLPDKHNTFTNHGYYQSIESTSCNHTTDAPTATHALKSSPTANPTAVPSPTIPQSLPPTNSPA